MIIMTSKMGFCVASLLLMHSDIFTGKLGRSHQWKSNLFSFHLWLWRNNLPEVRGWRSLLEESREDIETFSGACSALLIQNILLQFLHLLLLIFSACSPNWMAALIVLYLHRWYLKGVMCMSVYYFLWRKLSHTCLQANIFLILINDFPNN